MPEATAPQEEHLRSFRLALCIYILDNAKRALNINVPFYEREAIVEELATMIGPLILRLSTQRLRKVITSLVNAGALTFADGLQTRGHIEWRTRLLMLLKRGEDEPLDAWIRRVCKLCIFVVTELLLETSEAPEETEIEPAILVP